MLTRLRFLPVDHGAWALTRLRDRLPVGESSTILRLLIDDHRLPIIISSTVKTTVYSQEDQGLREPFAAIP
jgi:hypothetical protein